MAKKKRKQLTFCEEKNKYYDPILHQPLNPITPQVLNNFERKERRWPSKTKTDVPKDDDGDITPISSDLSQETEDGSELNQPTGGQDGLPRQDSPTSRRDFLKKKRYDRL